MSFDVVLTWDDQCGFDNGTRAVVKALRHFHGDEVRIHGFMEQRNDGAMRDWLASRGVKVYYSRGVDPLKLKAHALLRLFKYHDAERIVFMDSDILLVGSLAKMLGYMDGPNRIVGFEDNSCVTWQTYKIVTGEDMPADCIKHQVNSGLVGFTPGDGVVKLLERWSAACSDEFVWSMCHCNQNIFQALISYGHALGEIDFTLYPQTQYNCYRDACDPGPGGTWINSRTGEQVFAAHAVGTLKPWDAEYPVRGRPDWQDMYRWMESLP